jgi:hypothetical protein
LAESSYFRGFGKIEKRCPTALARGLNDGDARCLPELLCLHARRDCLGAIDLRERFWDAWVEKGVKGDMKEVAEKENNDMSTILGLDLGMVKWSSGAVDVLG